jgi:hypothetical protein
MFDSGMHAHLLSEARYRDASVQAACTTARDHYSTCQYNLVLHTCSSSSLKYCGQLTVLSAALSHTRPRTFREGPERQHKGLDVLLQVLVCCWLYKLEVEVL